MKLNKKQREELKMKFGGHCAYCGCELGSKWHADHIEAVKRDFDMKKCQKTGYMIPVANGVLFKPQNDTLENMNPSCAPCNINKSAMSLETWRRSLTHYRDVQMLRDSNHARHLLRFGLIEIKQEPVVFYFERLEVCGG